MLWSFAGVPNNILDSNVRYFVEMRCLSFRRDLQPLGPLMFARLRHTGLTNFQQTLLWRRSNLRRVATWIRMEGGRLRMILTCVEFLCARASLTVHFLITSSYLGLHRGNVSLCFRFTTVESSVSGDGDLEKKASLLPLLGSSVTQNKFRAMPPKNHLQSSANHFCVRYAEGRYPLSTKKQCAPATYQSDPNNETGAPAMAAAAYSRMIEERPCGVLKRRSVLI